MLWKALPGSGSRSSSAPQSVHQQSFGPIPERGSNLQHTESRGFRAKISAPGDGTKVAKARTSPRSTKQWNG